MLVSDKQIIVFNKYFIYCVVCGTTGKRKACKDCSCGLAEELEAGQTEKPAVKSATSSCGSVGFKFFYWI